MPTLYGMDCTILGKIEAERPCDCCGTTLLKTAVVVRDDIGHDHHFGRSCAAALVCGNRSATTRVDALVRAAEHETNERAAAAADKLKRVATDRGTANRWFAQTRRPVVGSYFAERGGEVVRVDASDAADAAFFAARGFVQTTPPAPAL